MKLNLPSIPNPLENIMGEVTPTVSETKEQVTSFIGGSVDKVTGSAVSMKEGLAGGFADSVASKVGSVTDAVKEGISGTAKPLGDMTSVPDITDMSCQELVNALSGKVDSFLEALKGPAKMVSSLGSLLASGIEFPDFSFPDLSLPGLGISLPDFGSLSMSGLEDALGALLDCPLIADSLQGLKIAEAMDGLMDGIPVPGDLLEDILSNSKDALLGKVDTSLNSSPIGKVDALTSAYDKAIASAGVHEKVGFVNAILECASLACKGDETAEKIRNEAQEGFEGVRTKAGLWTEGVTENIALVDEKIPELAKAHYSKVTGEVAAFKDQITSKLAF